MLCNNWRATKNSVVDMATHIESELAARHYTAVIFQLLDKNMFFAQCEDGSRIPARRAIDGKYHVDGELVLTDKDNQYAILKLCEPLWNAAKDKHAVVVGPLPRFSTAGCCEDTDHISKEQTWIFTKR